METHRSLERYICSYDTRDENISADVGRYAVKIGGNLKQIEKELKENVRLRVSTAEIFEDTAENPELILESSWDLSQVNRENKVCTGNRIICNPRRI